MTIVTMGLDLAKSVFQAHGIDENGATVLVKKLHRKQMLTFFSKLPPCLISVEACGTAHYWARTLSAMGHSVRLIPPSYVKAYVKRGKSDALDAEAICEAVQRPTMRFVPAKTVEQQAILTIHRTRSLLVRQRTMLAGAPAHNACQCLASAFGGTWACCKPWHRQSCKADQRGSGRRECPSSHGPHCLGDVDAPSHDGQW